MKSNIIKGFLPYPLEYELLCIEGNEIANKLKKLEGKTINAILKQILKRNPIEQDFSKVKIYREKNQIDRYQIIYDDCILGQIVKSIESEIMVEFFPKDFK